MMATLQVSLLVMGLSSIVAQVVLLREILVSFYGNELTIGIVLANWLALEALGSLLSGRPAEKTVRKTEVFVCLQLFFSMALPAMVFLSRVFKNLLIAAPGETVGLIPVFYSSFLILLPVAIPHGALFTYGSRLYGEITGKEPASIGNVYLFETLGILFGGLFLTYLLIPYLHSFEITILLSLLNASVSALLLWPDPRLPYSVFRRNLWGFSLFFSLLCLTGLLAPGASWLQVSSIRSQWKGMGIIHYENSIYGNIAVAQTGEQVTFFNNGIPAVITPVPDIASVEDFVHFPLLFHRKPETVLILGGGAGGVIHEILKYPVARIDYVELDPLLLHLVHRFSPPLTRSEISDPRVAVHHTDGRFFIGGAATPYDLIFIGFTAPKELQTNRFFSMEFFRSARKKMSPEGILALTLPGSLTYLSRELRDLNSCILETLKQVFPAVRVIPGESNLFLAFNSEAVEKESTPDRIERFKARRILTKQVNPAYIGHRLQGRWSDWFSHALEGGSFQINSDFHPWGVFYTLSYWNALFSPALRQAFPAFSKISTGWMIGFILVFSLVVWVPIYRNPSFSIHSVSYGIFTTGLTGMIFNLLILFSFQILFGYLYHQVGLLITLFMMGIALGNILTARSLDKIKNPLKHFLLIEIGAGLFSLLLPFLISFLGSRIQEGSNLPRIILYFTSLIAGSFIGLQFPLASKIYLADRMKRTGGRVAGLIYGADLFGGFFGGLLGAFILLPILGLRETCWIAAALKASSLFLCCFFAKYGTMERQN